MNKDILPDLSKLKIIEVPAINNFSRDRRRGMEKLGRPIADEVYHTIFPGIQDIHRSPIESNEFVDRELGIDCFLTMPNGMRLSIQEKFYSPEFLDYKSLTVEYLQDPTTGEKGDWYKLASQCYFVGYFCKCMKEFALWVMVNWVSVVLLTREEEIYWVNEGNNDKHAKANFRYCFINNLPSSCIIARSPNVFKCSHLTDNV